MKKRLIDEMSNINEEFIEKSIEIDSKEKLMKEKQGEVYMKRRNVFKWFALGLTCVILAAVGIFFVNNNRKVLTGNNTNTNNTNKIVTVEKRKLLSELQMSGNGIEDFDFYFMKLNNDGSDMVYSPISIKYALEMLSEGTKGESKKQLDTLLGSYRAGKYFNSKNMSFANAFFVNNDIKDAINEDYVKTLKDKFNAEVIYDDFNDAKAINKWISQKTLNLLKDVVGDSDVVGHLFALVNALAIDMEWVNKIQPDPRDSFGDEQGYSLTYDHEYASLYVNARDVGESMTFIIDGKEEFVSAMRFGSIFNNYNIVEVLGEENIRKTVTDAYNKWLEEDYNKPYAIENFDQYLDDFIADLNKNYHKSGTSTDYRYFINDDVKVFAKDLKKYNGTQLEYIQIMPTKVSLKDYIEHTSSEDIRKLVNSLIELKYQNFKEGVVTIVNGVVPAFKTDFRIDLVKSLNELGIYDIFVPELADLSGISSAGGYIDSVLHQATIEFSNEGIKAAAATMVGGAGDDDNNFYYFFDVPIEVIDLTFDNPFLYIIRDKTTGEVWFTGTVYNPIDVESVLENFEEIY